MEIKINRSVAEETQQNIDSSGSGFTESVIQAVTGGNTTGVEQSNTLSASVGDILGRYKSIIARDSQQITFLATQFDEFDKNMGNKMRIGQL